MPDRTEPPPCWFWLTMAYQASPELATRLWAAFAPRASARQLHVLRYAHQQSRGVSIRRVLREIHPQHLLAACERLEPASLHAPRSAEVRLFEQHILADTVNADCWHL